MNGKTMKKIAAGKKRDLEPEYRFDYSKSKPNRFASRFKGKAVAVVLEPDVSELFPTSDAVNQALRLLATVARKRAYVAKRSSTSKARRSNKAMQPTKAGKQAS